MVRSDNQDLWRRGHRKSALLDRTDVAGEHHCQDLSSLPTGLPRYGMHYSTDSRRLHVDCPANFVGFNLDMIQFKRSLLHLTVSLLLTGVTPIRPDEEAV